MERITKKRQNFIHHSNFSENYRKIGGKLCIQDKGSTHLQELACHYKTPLYKTQYSENLVD